MGISPPIYYYRGRYKNGLRREVYKMAGFLHPGSSTLLSKYIAKKSSTNFDDIVVGNGAKKQLCTLSQCCQDEDEKKIQCFGCQRWLHYECTKLPSYQLSLFLTRGYRNCVDVPKIFAGTEYEILELNKDPGRSKMELTSALHQRAQENESHMEINVALTKEYNHLRGELTREKEVSSKLRDEVLALKSTVTSQGETIQMFEEGEARYQAIIKNLENNNGEGGSGCCVIL